MTLNYRKIMSYVVVFALALVTGVSVGQIYVGTLESNPNISAQESQLRDPDIDKLYGTTAGKTPMDFTGVELYQLAEYYISQNDFFKVMTGLVNAPMDIKQNMRGEKLKTGGKFVYNKLSPSTNSMSPPIHSQVRFDIGNNNEVKEVKINSKVNILNPDDDPKNGYKLSYNESDFETFSNEKYVETFNTQPTSYLPYIISSKVCPASSVSKPTKNSDGTYSFEVNLSGDYLSFSALYYSYEIKFSSGFEKLPKWDSLKMTVVVDSSFRFVSIDYVEKYKMYVSGLGYMGITDEFSDTFQYDNLPSYQSVCDGEVK